MLYYWLTGLLIKQKLNIWLARYPEISLSSRNYGVDGEFQCWDLERLGGNDKTNSDWEDQTQNPLYYKIINVNILLYSGCQSAVSNVAPWPPGSLEQVEGKGGGGRLISP